MSTVHHLWPHRHHRERFDDEHRVRAVLEGVVALVALAVLIGGLAGFATWAVVRLFDVAAG